MSHESDPFACKSREQWMREAAKAIIAATMPSHRYMLVREGFVAFQTMAKPLFKELAGLHFDGNELRKIFEYIAGWTHFKEGHLHPYMEMALDQTKRRSWKADEEPPLPEEEDVIETERVHRGVAEKKGYKDKGRLRAQ